MNTETPKKLKRRIVIELDRRPDLRAALESLHEKTGMFSSIDIILIALKRWNAAMPNGAKAAGAVNMLGRAR